VILADSSAWIEYDRATGSTVDNRMTELIERDGPIVVTEPVVMEVLAGARTDLREQELRKLLQRFPSRPIQPAGDFEGAARSHRRCRQVGVTPGGLIDCLIVTIAQRCGDTLLAQDSDIRRVAEVMGVPLDPGI
jgi:predicted nucleic acid-binding protein